MKTKILTPVYFLVHKDLVLKITKNSSLGRSQGDFILEDNHLLSSIHCEFRPTMTQLFIVDKSSTNGVYINNQKILPEQAAEVHPGDLVKLGQDEYRMLIDDKEVKRLVPPPDRRKGARPENLYTFKNLLNFYSANKIYRSLYFIIILSTIVSSFVNLQMSVQIPSHLDFLGKLYTEQIILSGIRLIFIVWFLSLLHSFAMVLYLNRNPFRQVMGVALYFVCLFNVANFIHGPMGEFKGYLVEREQLQQIQIDSSAITHLKNITSKQASLTTAYQLTLKKLPDEQKTILKKDFTDVMLKADQEIKKISLN